MGTFIHKNPTSGFLFSLILIIAYQTFTAILTQFFGVFNFRLILLLNAIPFVVVLYFFIKNKAYKEIRVGWFFAIALFIIFLQLWSVHNSYTGEITTVNGFAKVEDMTYRYPYFSDEWVTTLLSKYTIETGNLPTVNPMNNNSPITNMLIPYFSLTSNFFLLSDVGYIENYFLLPLLTGFTILLLSYFLLRDFGLNKTTSIISIFLITYITNGSNLPGIWYTLPYTFGLILFLINLIGIQKKDFKIILSSALLGIIIYPPIFVFILPCLLFYFFKESHDKKKYLSIMASVIATAIIGLIIFRIGIQGRSFSELIQIIFRDYIFREGVEGGIPKYNIFRIVPLLALGLFPLSYYYLFSRKNYLLLIPVSIGLIFWSFYTVTTKVFLIEYTRIVTITSILVVIVAAFYLDLIIEYFKDYTKQIQVTALVIFLLLGFNYTKINDWDSLKLYIPEMDKSLSPAAPANQYLHKDDLKLFRKLTNETFIAPDWKGLVIGVLTDNVPMRTKPSIIGNNYFDYNLFMNVDCVEKQKILNFHHVNYVYTPPLDCDFLIERGKSSEGLRLYMVNR